MDQRRYPVALETAAAVLAAFATACSVAAVPCRSLGQCGAGQECLANRCLPLGSEPVPPDVDRLVVPAQHVGLVRLRGSSSRSMPPTVMLGGPRPEALLAWFSGGWAAPRVEAAFLLLQPDPSSDAGLADLALRVQAIREPFAPGVTLDAPTAIGSSAQGLAGASPLATIRVDVTELLRSAGGYATRGWGVRVEAKSASSEGLLVLTGSMGAGPRLEVYARRRKAAPKP